MHRYTATISQSVIETPDLDTQIDIGWQVASPARRARLRPSNYAMLSAREQWAIDKRLGILDWDGQ